MHKFGQTWWGEKWLQALNRIDFSNRLERGRRYANNGSVKSIQIEGNVVHARVQGSMRQPYEVTIVAPPFFEKEKKLFLSKIRENPLMLSRLLNRELPRELLDIGTANNIRIFPQTWQDLKLSCSCPDWAVPCKHLAAVIYLVANEIDQNPFLVFKLHQFDLAASLGELKVDITEHEQEKIFSWTDCLDVRRRPVKRKKKESPVYPDFSLMDDLSATIPLLFPAGALFYSGDMKQRLQLLYKLAARDEARSLQAKKDSSQAGEEALRYHQYQLEFQQLAGVEVIVTDEHSRSRKISLQALSLLLAQTGSKYLENYSPSFILLYRVFRFCNILVERQAILPRLFLTGGTYYSMLWVPALLNDSVKKIFDDLLTWMPDELCHVLLSPVPDFMVQELNYAMNRNVPGFRLKMEEGLLMLCSHFISESVREAAGAKPAKPASVTQKDQKILDLFFNGKAVSFSGFGEQELPNTIQRWLRRFYLADKKLTPVIRVEEASRGGFEVEVLVKNEQSSIPRLDPLHLFLEGRQSAGHFQVLKDLNLLSEYFPDLNKIVESGGRQLLNYSAQTFSSVLLQILPALKLFGIKAMLPRSLQKLLRPQVSLKLGTVSKNKGYFSLDDLITYDWCVAIGDTHLTRAEFSRLSRQASGLVKIREHYVMLDGDAVSKIIRQLEDPPAPGRFQLLQAALSGEFEGAQVKTDASLSGALHRLFQQDNIKLPVGLQAKLRPYQLRGFHWMYKNSRIGFGSLLADDMGLGKTLQVITTLLKLKEEKKLEQHPALVVVPTTLLSNWQSEIVRFAPSLRTVIYHGTGRKFSVKHADVMITTYGMTRTDFKKINTVKWGVVVIDEAQNIKNPEVSQTKAVKKIKSKIKIAMSGTPVENRLNEYWSIFDFANPGYLGTLNWFNDHFSRPIELNQDRHKLDTFKTITSPFIMRRVKTDKKIISDLPDKIENNQYCHLSREQAALYQSVTRDLMKSVEKADGIERRGLVLKLLITLKQVCNHPAQYLKNEVAKPESSGKLMMLFQLLETIYENNEKVLIFSQFREMGTILRQIIFDHFGKKALQLHGGCSRKERDEMVRAFQQNKWQDTFILSIKAGGTGLNLTAAANVIHFDLWWNPAVEAQATDRAFRIGQKQNVMVHRLITKGTLEEKIDEMLNSKRNLANLTMSAGEKWIGDLNDKELQKLVTLEN